MKAKAPTPEDIYDAYIDAQETFEAAQGKLEELQEGLEDELAGIAAVLDEVRDQFEQCRHLLRQFNRRTNPERLMRTYCASNNYSDREIFSIPNFYTDESGQLEMPF